GAMEDVLRVCRRVVVIGVHGWFPGMMIRTMVGEVGWSQLTINIIPHSPQE
ncbi:hypothetical protein CPB84DRAFT_1691435, partial [Gymnopilus junonius]